MRRAVDGLLVLICTGMMSWSVVSHHLFTAALYMAGGIFFYLKLEHETLD